MRLSVALAALLAAVNLGFGLSSQLSNLQDLGAPRHVLDGVVPTIEITEKFIREQSRGGKLAALDVLTKQECSATEPCGDGSCCNSNGLCGYLDEHCRPAAPVTCVSNCDAHAQCGQHSINGQAKCPLNLCCSSFGTCGHSDAFCGQSSVDNSLSCQSNCAETSAPRCSKGPLSRRMAYFQSWNARRFACDKAMPDQLKLDGLTDLVFAFATIDPRTFEVGYMNTGDGFFYQKFLALPKVSKWIAIGGWEFSDPGATRYTWSNMTSTPDNRQVFIKSVQKFLATWSFSGVEFNWEWPGHPSRGGNANDNQNYIALLTELRAALGSSIRLSVVLPAQYEYLKYLDPKGLETHVDSVTILTYDLHGVWDASIPGMGPYIRPHTALNEIDDSLKLLWSAGVDPKKVNLGLANYGRGYTITDKSCSSIGCPFSGPSKSGECTGLDGMLSICEIKKIVRDKKVSLKWLPDTIGVKEMTWDDQWIGFEDVETLQMKADFASQRCLGGTSLWAIDYGVCDGSPAASQPPVVIPGLPMPSQSGGIATATQSSIAATFSSVSSVSTTSQSTMAITPSNDVSSGVDTPPSSTSQYSWTQSGQTMQRSSSSIALVWSSSITSSFVSASSLTGSQRANSSTDSAQQPSLGQPSVSTGIPSKTIAASLWPSSSETAGFPTVVGSSTAQFNMTPSMSSVGSNLSPNPTFTSMISSLKTSLLMAPSAASSKASTASSFASFTASSSASTGSSAVNSSLTGPSTFLGLSSLGGTSSTEVTATTGNASTLVGTTSRRSSNAWNMTSTNSSTVMSRSTYLWSKIASSLATTPSIPSSSIWDSTNTSNASLQLPTQSMSSPSASFSSWIATQTQYSSTGTTLSSMTNAAGTTASSSSTIVFSRAPQVNGTSSSVNVTRITVTQTLTPPSSNQPMIMCSMFPCVAHYPPVILSVPTTITFAPYTETLIIVNGGSTSTTSSEIETVTDGHITKVVTTFITVQSCTTSTTTTVFTPSGIVTSRLPSCGMFYPDPKDVIPTPGCIFPSANSFTLPSNMHTIPWHGYGSNYTDGLNLFNPCVWTSQNESSIIPHQGAQQCPPECLLFDWCAPFCYSPSLPSPPPIPCLDYGWCILFWGIHDSDSDSDDKEDGHHPHKTHLPKPTDKPNDDDPHHPKPSSKPNDNNDNNDRDHDRDDDKGGHKKECSLFGCKCGWMGMGFGPGCPNPHFPFSEDLPCGLFGCDPCKFFGCPEFPVGIIGTQGFCRWPGGCPPCPPEICSGPKCTIPGGCGPKPGPPPPAPPNPDKPEKPTTCEERDKTRVTERFVYCTEKYAVSDFPTSTKNEVASTSSTVLTTYCVTAIEATLSACPGMIPGFTTTTTQTKATTLTPSDGPACTRAPLSLDDDEGDNMPDDGHLASSIIFGSNMSMPFSTKSFRSVFPTMITTNGSFGFNVTKTTMSTMTTQSSVKITSSSSSSIWSVSSTSSSSSMWSANNTSSNLWSATATPSSSWTSSWSSIWSSFSSSSSSVVSSVSSSPSPSASSKSSSSFNPVITTIAIPTIANPTSSSSVKSSSTASSLISPSPIPTPKNDCLACAGAFDKCIQKTCPPFDNDSLKLIPCARSCLVGICSDANIAPSQCHAYGPCAHPACPKGPNQGLPRPFPIVISSGTRTATVTVPASPSTATSATPTPTPVAVDKNGRWWITLEHWLNGQQSSLAWTLMDNNMNQAGSGYLYSPKGSELQLVADSQNRSPQDSAPFSITLLVTQAADYTKARILIQMNKIMPGCTDCRVYMQTEDRTGKQPYSVGTCIDCRSIKYGAELLYCDDAQKTPYIQEAGGWKRKFKCSFFGY